MSPHLKAHILEAPDSSDHPDYDLSTNCDYPEAFPTRLRLAKSSADASRRTRHRSCRMCPKNASRHSQACTLAIRAPILRKHISPFARAPKWYQRGLHPPRNNSRRISKTTPIA